MEEKGFSQAMREHFLKLGKTEDEIAALENGLASKGQAAREAGLESKDNEPPADQPVYVTATEVAEAVQAVARPIIEALATLSTQLMAMQGEVKSLQESDATRIAKAAAATPSISLQELIAAQMFPGVVVDGRSALAKAGPKQTPVEPAGYTPSPFLNGLMAQAQGGG